MQLTHTLFRADNGGRYYSKAFVDAQAKHGIHAVTCNLRVFGWNVMGNRPLFSYRVSRVTPRMYVLARRSNESTVPLRATHGHQ